MKKVLFLLTAVSGLFLSSCNNKEVAPDSIDDVLAAVEASAARTAAVNDTVTKGKCKGKLTSVEIATLPVIITTYINAKFAGSTIKFAGKDEKGQTVVGISLNSVETGLLFDASGAFIQTLTHYGKKAKLTEVNIATLPASIGTYITANYSGYSVKKAGKDVDGNILVGIDNGTTRKVLKFDATNKFVEELAIPPHGKRGKKN
jgi:hypothetical protein